MNSEERLALMYQGYTEALVWAEIPLAEEQSDGSDARTFEDLGYTCNDFSADAMIDICMDLRRLDMLVAQHGIVLPDEAWQQLGMDLYFERQRHGVGFRDRRDLYGPAVELLDVLVKREFSETYAWIDGNNRIQVETYTPRSASCV